ncbi:MAG: M55 family metallopeptidase [Desulfobacteraceae bacterium]
MKFLIGVDCDGPACVVGDPGRALSLSRDMPFAREQATRETDAAARALLDAGAERVVVWDNHGFGSNLVFDRLPPGVEVMLGTGFGRRFPGLDETFSGVLMIGYHAMEGTPNGVLAHTYSPDAFREVRVNGRSAGEIALDASVAGEFGVPLIFLASDDHGCEEALQFMPCIETVATKQGLGRNCAFSKHPAVAVEEIYEGVSRALGRIHEMKPFTFRRPPRVEIHFKKPIQALKARIRRKGWRLAGPLTLRATLPSMLEWQC